MIAVDRYALRVMHAYMWWMQQLSKACAAGPCLSDSACTSCCASSLPPLPHPIVLKSRLGPLFTLCAQCRLAATTDPRAVRMQTSVPRADGHVHSTAHVHPRGRRGGASSFLVRYSIFFGSTTIPRANRELMGNGWCRVESVAAGGTVLPLFVDAGCGGYSFLLCADVFLGGVGKGDGDLYGSSGVVHLLAHTSR